MPGLRREEVAMLAGVSADYYVRLEQGRDQHPSAQVLDALAASAATRRGRDRAPPQPCGARRAPPTAPEFEAGAGARWDPPADLNLA